MWSNAFWQGYQDHNQEKTVFSTSGIGRTGYPHTKSWTLTLHHIQKLTQNGLRPKRKS